jgi:hypothetical protein
MGEEIMALLSLELILNLVCLASVVLFAGYGQRIVMLAGMGYAFSIE